MLVRKKVECPFPSSEMKNPEDFFFHLREKCPRGRGFAPELARVVIETTPKQGRKITFWWIFFRGNEKRRENREGIRYRRKEITKVCI